jgi:hypothetical protein
VDKETVKMLLASYRPQDAEDPIFADALREVARDPELAAWFEEMQRFDVVVGEKFRTASVPAEVKARVLADARTASIPAANTIQAKRWWAVPLAIAAMLCAALIVWQNVAPVPASRALALQAISYSEEMPALQFVCFDAGEVAKWINKHPRSRHLGLKLNQPAEALSMRMIGSSVVDWKGQPVTMVCLQDGKRMAMLYILTAADAALPDGATETVEERGWTVRTIKTGGQVRVLTVKGRAEEQDFQVPF